MSTDALLIVEYIDDLVQAAHERGPSHPYTQLLRRQLLRRLGLRFDNPAPLAGLTEADIKPVPAGTPDPRD